MASCPFKGKEALLLQIRGKEADSEHREENTVARRGLNLNKNRPALTDNNK